MVPLPNVKGDILEKVLEWAIDHKVSESKRKSSYLGKFQQDDPTPAENDEEKTDDDISPKDAEFLKVELVQLLRYNKEIHQNNWGPKDFIAWAVSETQISTFFQ